MTPTRYYAFDSLRAAMMFLGVVIHSAINYSSSEDATWPLRAAETSDLFYFLVDFIHSFRMPVFFLIAGFFGAMLYFTRGPQQMLMNRFRRIFLPFIVFLIAMRPFMSYAFFYCMDRFHGEAPMPVSEHFSTLGNYLPMNLSHLWFLYYLFLVSLLAYLTCAIAKGRSFVLMDKVFTKIFSKSIYRLLVLTLFSFALLTLSGAKSFQTSVSWIPDPGIMTYFLLFYGVGWLLYRNKTLVNSMLNSDVMISALGLLLFVVKFHYENSLSLIALQVLNSIITCSLGLGLIGLSLRFANKQSRSISYLVQASYWVYLVHFSIALFLSGWLQDSAMAVYLKFLIVLIATTVICMFSYHFLVHRTFIGKFLNGKRAD